MQPRYYVEGSVDICQARALFVVVLSPKTSYPGPGIDTVAITILYSAPTHDIIKALWLMRRRKR